MKEMTDVVKQKFSSFFNSQTNLTVHTAEENKDKKMKHNDYNNDMKKMGSR